MEEDLSEVAAEVRASSSLVEAKKENLFFEELPPEGMLYFDPATRARTDWTVRCGLKLSGSILKQIKTNMTTRLRLM